MTTIQLLFVLKYLLVAISMIGSAHALGHLVSLAIKYTPIARSPLGLASFLADPLLRFFYQTCMGLAVWSYFVFTLGISHLLYAAPLWLVFIGSIGLEIALIYRSVRSVKLVGKPGSKGPSAATQIVSANDNSPETQEFDATVHATTENTTNTETVPTEGAIQPENHTNRGRIRWADSLFIILVLAYSSTLFLKCLEPPHIWDDTCYHLPFARLYADSHALVVGKLLRFPVWNQFAEMLFTAAYMLVDTRGAQLVAWNSAILTLIGIYAFLREKSGPYIGLIGVLIICSSRVLAETCFTAYVETTICLFITGFLIALVRISSNNRREMLILAGTCAGCAVATKYTAGLVVVLTLALWLSTELIKKALKFRDLVYLLTPAMIVTVPWFLRNYICSGNPVFPFLPNVFGLGGLWNSDDLKFQWAMWKSRCIVPVTLDNIVRLPWILSFECYKFKDYTFSRLWHLAFVLSLVALAIKRDRVLFILLVIAEAYLIWWFVTCQSVRYSVPVVPVVALTGGWACHIIWTKFAHLSFAKPLAAVALVLIIGLGITKGTLRFNKGIAVYATKQEQQQFLRMILPTYPAYEFMNGQEEGNLYGLWDDRMNFYYTNGTFIGSDFGPGRFQDFLNNTRARGDLLGFLGQFNTKYLLIAKTAPVYWRRRPEYKRLENIRGWDGFQVIFEDKETVVYRIRY